MLQRVVQRMDKHPRAAARPPRFHTVKYAGVLAPASSFRARIKPQPQPVVQLTEPAQDDPPSAPAVSARTAATKAMGKGSTQHQHLVQTEVPTKLLEEWLSEWSARNAKEEKLRVELRPHTAGSELLELTVRGKAGSPLLNVVFSPMQDRAGRQLLAIRDQNTHPSLRRKRLMTLAQLFLMLRYKPAYLYYLTPSEDNEAQANSMQKLGVFRTINNDSGLLISAEVDSSFVSRVANTDRKALLQLLAAR